VTGKFYSWSFEGSKSLNMINEEERAVLSKQLRIGLQMVEEGNAFVTPRCEKNNDSNNFGATVQGPAPVFNPCRFFFFTSHNTGNQEIRKSGNREIGKILLKTPTPGASQRNETTANLASLANLLLLHMASRVTSSMIPYGR